MNGEEGNAVERTRHGSPGAQARAARSRWLPAGRRGPMPWIIAIIMFLTLLAAAAGLALYRGLDVMHGELAGGYTVQIVEANATRRADQTARVTALLRREKAVRSVDVVPEKRLREQLAPWIGSDAPVDELPIPAMIDVAFAPGTGAAQVTRIGEAILSAAPTARMESHQSFLAPVERLMRGLMWLAGGLVALMLLATGAIAMLSARTAHATHRATIDIMHLLGATDIQIARLIQRRMALDALFGAMIGGGTAAVTVLLVGRALADTRSELTQTIALPWIWAPALLAIPLFAVLVATLTARLTVHRALERSL